MKKSLLAKDIMTREVKTLAPGSMLSEVASFMTEHSISGVPIVDFENHLVGVISESDLIEEAHRRHAIPRLAVFGMYAMPKEDIYEAFRDGWHLPVSDLMSRKLITAGEEATVEEVAHLMVNRRINRVPILRGGKLVGIVTREDILHSIQPPNDCEPSSN